MKIEPFYNHLLVQDGLQKITIEGYKKVLTKYFKENKHFDRLVSLDLLYCLWYNTIYEEI